MGGGENTPFYPAYDLSPRGFVFEVGVNGEVWGGLAEAHRHVEGGGSGLGFFEERRYIIITNGALA